MAIPKCKCGCGKDAQLRKDSPTTYRKFIKGHRGRDGDRLKAKKALGRPIPKGVEVHHHGVPIKGGEGRFEDTSQLVLCENHKYHCYLHMRQRAFFGVKVWRCGQRTVSTEESGA